MELREFRDRVKNRKLRALVIGDAMLDIGIYGFRRRVSQETGVPILEHTTMSFYAGGAANTAMNLKALGAEVVLVAPLNSLDVYAPTLTRILREAGIHFHPVGDNHELIVKTRVWNGNKPVLRIDKGTTYLPVCADDLDPYSRDCDLIVISDYGKGAIMRASLQRLIDDTPLQVFIDPKPNGKEPLTGATVLIPNAAEARLIAQQAPDAEKWREAVRKVRGEYKCKTVVVKRGDKGCSLSEAGDNVENFPAQVVQAVDPCGAGDTFVAAFALSYRLDGSARRACALANKAAASVVAQLGTAVPLFS